MLIKASYDLRTIYTQEKIDELLLVLIDYLGEKTLIKLKAYFKENYFEVFKSKPLEVLKFLVPKSKKSFFDKTLAHLTETSFDQGLIDIKENCSNIYTKKEFALWNEFLFYQPNKIEDLYYFISQIRNIYLYESLLLIPKYEEIIFTLKDLGYSLKVITNIIKELKEDTLKDVLNNPYLPYRYGEDFFVCDEIALNKINISHESPNRILYAGLEVLREVEKEGDTYLDLNELIFEISHKISCDSLDFIGDIIYLMSIKDVPEFIIEDNRVFRRVTYHTEKKITYKTNVLIQTRLSLKDTELKTAKNILHKSPLSEQQKSFIYRILNHSIAILTGGPGTGKTTCVKTLVEMITAIDKSFVLCSPTGKAARRMSEVTEQETYTIHALLGYKWKNNTFEFLRNEYYHLPYDYIIVDESSLLDIFLFNGLLNAMKKDARLILVGDIYQNQSVQMGNILKDLKASNRVPFFELTEVFRQSQDNIIIHNAIALLRKEIMQEKKNEFEFVEINKDIDFYSYLNNKLEDSPPQILTPMKKGYLGVESINRFLQEKVIDVSSPFISYHDKKFYVGDRIIQLKNNKYKKVYNGDIGNIKELDAFMILVDFNGKEVVYLKNELYQIDLAYALTIHKSQGSEWEETFVVLDPVSQIVSIEMLYTAITRSKKKVTLVSTVPLHILQQLPFNRERKTLLKDSLK